MEGFARTFLCHTRNRKRAIERRGRVNPTVERTDPPTTQKKRGERRGLAPFAPHGDLFVVPSTRGWYYTLQRYTFLAMDRVGHTPYRRAASGFHAVALRSPIFSQRPNNAVAMPGVRAAHELRTIYVPAALGRRMCGVLSRTSKLYDFQPKAEQRRGVAFACTIYAPAALGRRMLAMLRPASKLYVANNFGA